jgi:hypothetical protein
MDYKITRKALGPLPLKSRLLHLPDLGRLKIYAAHDAITEIYTSHDHPGLITDRTAIFSTQGAFSNAWRHETGHGIVVIFRDLSALVLAGTDAPERFEILPLVFLLPATVPFPAGHPLTGKTNMRYGLLGCGTMIGIHPENEPDVFRAVEHADATGGEIGDLLKRTLQSIEAESRAWIKTFANPANGSGTSVHAGKDLPVALSKVRTDPETGHAPAFLINWLTKVCTHANKCLSSEANAISIHLTRPSFSQVDGSISFNVRIQTASPDDPAENLLAEHLRRRLEEIIPQNATPFDMNKVFPRIDILDPASESATQMQDLDADITTFAIIPMSNHERLQVEQLFGMNSIIQAAKTQSAVKG